MRRPDTVSVSTAAHRADRAVHATVTASRVVVGVVLAGVAVLAVAAPGAWSGPLVLTVAAAGLLAGLPHGAVDHVLAARLTGLSTLVATLAYAVVAATAWALLTWGGLAALVAVVVLSTVHFGLGELEAHRETGGWDHGRAATIAVAVAATGALLLPLARTDVATADVAAALSPGLVSVLAADAIRVTVVVCWLVAAAVTLVVALRAGRPGVVVDVLLVGALGVFAPPLVAFAVWFGGWHALRHTGRLLVVEPGCAALVSTGRTRAAVVRFARMAALPSAAAVGAVLVLGALTASAAQPETAIATALRILLALTVPHMLVVLFLDRQSAARRRTLDHAVLV